VVFSSHLVAAMLRCDLCELLFKNLSLRPSVPVNFQILDSKF
jgi:hypothetical protein